jgi:hypothetical protein
MLNKVKHLNFFGEISSEFRNKFSYVSNKISPKDSNKLVIVSKSS